VEENGKNYMKFYSKKLSKILSYGKMTQFEFDLRSHLYLDDREIYLDNPAPIAGLRFSVYNCPVNSGHRETLTPQLIVFDHGFYFP
jgi:hypothetical protein